jgi:hypothetical protein
VIVTFFHDKEAKAKVEEDLDLETLAARIETTIGPDKTSLPWLKFARFGEQRSARGSYRNNANVTTITGIEADYDGEVLGVDEAVHIIKDIGLTAIIYTSPSHTEAHPRFRILCPLSSEHPPVDRDRLLARLNGLYGGIFAKESWTLSQSYYFGSVKQNPAHRVLVIEGRCIDEADDLDAGAIGPSQTARSGDCDRGAHPASRIEDITDARIRGLVAALLGKVSSAPDGQKHRILFAIGRTLGGYLHIVGWSESEAVSQLVNALPASVKDWTLARRTAADAVARGVAKPLDFEERPYTGRRA